MGLIGFLLAPLLCHVPVVLIPSMLFIQRPVTWLEAISRHRATISCAPNFAFRLAGKRIASEERTDLDLSSWRIAGCGAEPIRPNDLLGFAQTFAAQGFRSSALLPMYGLAESTLAVTIGAPGAGLQTLTLDHQRMSEERRAVSPADPQSAIEIAACGFALPDHRIAVFDIDDDSSLNPLPDWRIGEIRIAGPSVMESYWDDPEQTSAVWAGEYLRTGDLGFMQNGQVQVCGRLKEMIIINGRNYFPQDIEDIIKSVPGVQEGSVVAFGVHGIFDTTSEHERVILAVRVSEHDKFEPEAAMLVVQSALGISIDIVELGPGQLAKTSSGKLQRMKMRELYETGQLRSFSHKETEPATDLLGVVSSDGLKECTSRNKESRR
jgi:acyl-CoA synthetase (AMP-forming)/AMP-acid ligase II